MIISISNGIIKYIYNDNASFTGVGDSIIKRASYVEPAEDNSWCVDFSPIGIKVKKEGFLNRKDAINYEIQYLENNLL